MEIKHIFRFILWIITNGNDEITDLIVATFGVYNILEILLDVLSTSDIFPAWLKCFEAADKIFVICFVAIVLRMIKNLVIAINTEADDVDEYLTILEEG